MTRNSIHAHDSSLIFRFLTTFYETGRNEVVEEVLFLAHDQTDFKQLFVIVALPVTTNAGSRGHTDISFHQMDTRLLSLATVPF
jgi:hypothetical protein